jgi:lysophospholipase L1-like esterase
MKHIQTDTHTTSNISRRKLLGGAASLAAFTVLGGTASVQAENLAKKIKLKKGAVIIFQGDSITDEGRKKDGADADANKTRGLGRGYAAMAAGLLHADYPDHELKIYNRGISGNKVPDLDKRWKEDVIDLKPDIVSIMVGVNDYWHTIAFGKTYKATVEDYETGYRKLIERTLKEIPGVRIVICDPFTFRDWKAYKLYQAVAEKLAAEFKLTFVPFQKTFDPLRKTVSAKFWLWDGVHPTSPGHCLMAKTWKDAVGI